MTKGIFRKCKNTVARLVWSSAAIIFTEEVYEEENVDVEYTPAEHCSFV